MRAVVITLIRDGARNARNYADTSGRWLVIPDVDAHPLNPAALAFVPFGVVLVRVRVRVRIGGKTTH